TENALIVGAPDPAAYDGDGDNPSAREEGSAPHGPPRCKNRVTVDYLFSLGSTGGPALPTAAVHRHGSLARPIYKGKYKPRVPMQQNHSVSGSEISGCSQPYPGPPDPAIIPLP